jgi:hypothetical protein
MTAPFGSRQVLAVLVPVCDKPLPVEIGWRGTKPSEAQVYSWAMDLRKTKNAHSASSGMLPESG